MKCIKCGAELDNQATACNVCNLVFTPEMKQQMLDYQAQMEEYNRQMEEYNRQMEIYNAHMRANQAAQPAVQPQSVPQPQPGAAPEAVPGVEQAQEAAQPEVQPQSVPQPQPGATPEIVPEAVPGVEQAQEAAQPVVQPQSVPQPQPGMMPGMMPVSQMQPGYQVGNLDFLADRYEKTDKKPVESKIPNVLCMLAALVCAMSVFLPYAKGATGRASMEASIWSSSRVLSLVVLIPLIASVVLSFICKKSVQIINFILTVIACGLVIFEFALTMYNIRTENFGIMRYGAYMGVVSSVILLISVPLWSLIFRNKNKEA
jgi:hypothetical protein